jgi:hypothetical protein
MTPFTKKTSGAHAGWLWVALIVAAGGPAAAETPAMPMAPAALAATSGGDQAVVLKWEASRGASSYTIFRSNTQNDAATHEIASAVTATTYTAKKLHNDTTYYFRVKAANAAGLSDFSREISATTKITGPPLPDGIYTLSPRSRPELRLQKANEETIVTTKSLAATGQRWRLTNVNLATYRISPAGATAATGGNGLDGGQWTLTPVSGGYRISPATAPKHALRATGTSVGSVVDEATRDDSMAQTWIVLTLPEGGPDGMPDPGTKFVPAGYRLVFSDEFDGDKIDLTKWETLAPYSQPHLNKEIECYSSEGAIVRDGVCILRAEQAPTACGPAYPWRSGAITSRAVFRSGYYEARIKVPQGQGMWPAFWTTSSKRWPPEWDFFEIQNMVGTLYQYMHPVKDAQLAWVRGAIGRESVYTAARGMPNPYDGYVIYGAEVTPGRIKLWINGRLSNEWQVSSGTTDPMWVNCDLAVGDSWAGNPDATTPRQNDMLVDYVRVYQSPAVEAAVQAH